MTHTYSFAVLDVFTATPYEGNQLGLVRIPKQKGPGGAAAPELSPAQQLKVAREFNFSETVFLYEDEEGEGKGRRRLDIWTPGVELPFAGHPTIGALCYIAQEEGGSLDQDLRLQLKAGPVEAAYTQATRSVEAEIPQNVRIHAGALPLEIVARSQPRLDKLLHTDGPSALEQACHIVSPTTGIAFILVNLPTVEQHLKSLVANPTAVEGVQLDSDFPVNFTGLLYYVHMPSAEEHIVKCRTRMVEASMGEDPATGSASCALASFLSLRAGGAGSEHDFEFEQGVEMGRRSVIRVKVTLDATGTGVAKVLLAGQAVVVMRGSLDL